MPLHYQQRHLFTLSALNPPAGYFCQWSPLTSSEELASSLWPSSSSNFTRLLFLPFTRTVSSVYCPLSVSSTSPDVTGAAPSNRVIWLVAILVSRVCCVPMRLFTSSLDGFPSSYKLDKNHTEECQKADSPK